MTAKLVRATVSWRFKMYDIAKEDGRYRVVSDLMNGSQPEAVGKLTVMAFVTPNDEQDIQTLLKRTMNSEITVRGKVDGITLRTAIVLSPAKLIH
jgi:F0F1-type ATP synthase delta subunit